MSQPSTQDLTAPFDPTAFTTITGAQLLQLVTGLSPNINTGFILISTDIAGVAQVPAANMTTKWQNYMWLRVQATYVTAYIWNPNGATDPTFLNWVTISSASIGPGSIQGFQIAANTIPATAIISLSSAQITGSVVAGWLAQLNIANTAYATNGLMNNNSPIFGDLNGVGSTVAQPVIGNLAVTQGKLALQSVAGNPVALSGQIKDNSITTLQLLGNTSLASIPLLNGAVDPATNVIVPTKSIAGLPTSVNHTPTPNVVAGDVLGVHVNVGGAVDGYCTMNRAILSLVDPIPVTDDNKIVQVNAGGTGYQLTPGVNNGLFGRLLSFLNLQSALAESTSTALANTGTAPTLGNTQLITGFGSAGTITYTPSTLGATSTLIVTVIMQMSGNNVGATIALFNGTTPVATAANILTNGTFGVITLTYILPNPGTSPIVFKVQWAVTSGTGYINTYQGTQTGVASFLKSSFIIQEVI